MVGTEISGWVVFPGEGPFGAPLAQYMKSRLAQLGAPFRFGFFNGIGGHTDKIWTKNGHKGKRE
jgi:hypothetical protein